MPPDLLSCLGKCLVLICALIASVVVIFTSQIICGALLSTPSDTRCSEACKEYCEVCQAVECFSPVYPRLFWQRGSSCWPLVILDKLVSQYNRNYYVRNSEKLKARSRSAYMAAPGKKKAAAAALLQIGVTLHPKKKIECSKAYNIAHKAERNAADSCLQSKCRKTESCSKSYYTANPEPKRAASRSVYRSNLT